jgi:hypothetical protein
MALFTYDLHLKAQANLVKKLSILHPQAMPLKPLLSTIYNESNKYIDKDSATYAQNIPHNLQLPFIFTYYNNIINANRTALKSSVQSPDVSRAIWYWGIDPTHSFFKDHEQIRYNIILLILAIILTGRSEYTTTEGRQFGWAFFMAWVELLENDDIFTNRDEFIDMWKTGPYDLIVFSEAQKQRVKDAIEALKAKVAQGAKQQALGKVSGVAAKRSSAFRGAEFMLEWFFVLEEPGMAQDFAADEVMEVEVDDELLGRVNWNAPMLKGLLIDIDRSMDTMQEETNTFWMGAEKAVELVEDKGGDAADAMTQLFGGMSI